MKSPSVGSSPGAASQVELQQRQAQMEKIATKGAEAIQKMAPQDKSEMALQVSGRMPDIKRSMQGRLLRRSVGDLEKLIGDTHLDRTIEAGERVAKFTESIDDENRAGIEAALLDIAQTAGATPQQFADLVGRIQLVVLNEKKGGLANLTKPQRAAVARLTTGNLEGLAAKVGQRLQSMAYEPVRQALDAPT